MNKKEILKKVGGILAELNEQYEYLAQSPDNLNDLELELFSANANFLSDHLSILVKLNDSTARNSFSKSSDTVREETPGPVHEERPPVQEERPAFDDERSSPHEEPAAPVQEEVPVADIQSDEPEPEVEPAIQFEEPEESLPEQDVEQEEESGIMFDFEPKPADRLFEQLFTKEEKSFIQKENGIDQSVEEDYIDFEEENDVEVEEVVVKAEEIPIPTVNDLLSKNMTQQTVASQFNSRQNKDLKSMISLNDKLLFVRDLFNGYSLAYSEAVELINRFDSFESADNFLKQNYAPKNNWAAKQDSTDKFYEILNRRFSK